MFLSYGKKKPCAIGTEGDQQPRQAVKLQEHLGVF